MSSGSGTSIGNCASIAYTTLVYLCLGITEASAQPEIQFDIEVTGGSAGFYENSFSQAGIETGDPEIFRYIGSLSDASGGEWQIDWNFKADPFPGGTGVEQGARLSPSLTIWNYLPDGFTGNENHLFFSIMHTLDVEQSFPPTNFFGNAGLNLQIDESPNDYAGRLMSVGGPMCNYLIDGIDEAQLFPDGFAMGGSNGPANIATYQNLDASHLDGSIPSTIGMRFDFDVTPGERVKFNCAFLFSSGDQPCPAECSPQYADGRVDVDDLLALISAWGTTNIDCDIAPKSGDGVVNVDDLLFLIQHWGPCP